MTIQQMTLRPPRNCTDATLERVIKDLTREKAIIEGFWVPSLKAKRGLEMLVAEYESTIASYLTEQQMRDPNNDMPMAVLDDEISAKADRELRKRPLVVSGDDFADEATDGVTLKEEIHGEVPSVRRQALPA